MLKRLILFLLLILLTDKFVVFIICVNQHSNHCTTMWVHLFTGRRHPKGVILRGTQWGTFILLCLSEWEANG